LVESLGLEAYDLGGYSLGGRTALRMLARGARPAHSIIAGQGLDAVQRTANPRGATRRVLAALANRDTLEPGSPDAEAAQWIVQSGNDPRALLNVLNTLVSTPDDALRRILTPTLVVVGTEDTDHASADEGAQYGSARRFRDVMGLRNSTASCDRCGHQLPQLDGELRLGECG
jgi:pimeloyl-ACP methyl ester carboxylesterase